MENQTLVASSNEEERKRSILMMFFLIISLEHTMRIYLLENEKERSINLVHETTLKPKDLVSHFSLIPG